MENEYSDFSAIYFENYENVLAFVYNISNNWSLAEDITQEAFVKAYKKLDSFRGESKMSVWLNRIAYNLFLDHKRKKSSQALAIDDDVLATKLTDMKNNLSKELEQKIMTECVHNKFLKLPENYRAPLFLDSHGYTNKEIADIVGCTLDNVKARLHRARKNIKKILGSDCTFYYDERNILC